MIGLFDDCDFFLLLDEFEEIIGIKIGYVQCLGDLILCWLLLDFYCFDDLDDDDLMVVDGFESFNVVLCSLYEFEIIDVKCVVVQQLLDMVLDNGGWLELMEFDVNVWIVVVNDFWLVFGVMFEIGLCGLECLLGNYLLVVYFNVYQWLIVLQEYFVLVLMGF